MVNKNTKKNKNNSKNSSEKQRKQSADAGQRQTRSNTTLDKFLQLDEKQLKKGLRQFNQALDTEEGVKKQNSTKKSIIQDQSEVENRQAENAQDESQNDQASQTNNERVNQAEFKIQNQEVMEKGGQSRKSSLDNSQNLKGSPKVSPEDNSIASSQKKRDQKQDQKEQQQANQSVSNKGNQKVGKLTSMLHELATTNRPKPKIKANDAFYEIVLLTAARRNFKKSYDGFFDDLIEKFPTLDQLTEDQIENLIKYAACIDDLRLLTINQKIDIKSFAFFMYQHLKQIYLDKAADYCVQTSTIDDNQLVTIKQLMPQKFQIKIQKLEDQYTLALKQFIEFDLNPSSSVNESISEHFTPSKSFSSHSSASKVRSDQILKQNVHKPKINSGMKHLVEKKCQVKQENAQQQHEESALKKRLFKLNAYDAYRQSAAKVIVPTSEPMKVFDAKSFKERADEISRQRMQEYKNFQAKKKNQ